MASAGSPPAPCRERAMTSLKSAVTKQHGAPEDMTWVQLFSALFSLAVVIVGPLVAWRLHGRRPTWVAEVGTAKIVTGAEAAPSHAAQSKSETGVPGP